VGEAAAAAAAANEVEARGRGAKKRRSEEAKKRRSEEVIILSYNYVVRPYLVPLHDIPIFGPEQSGGQVLIFIN
jgi:hypothetical protein